MIKSRFVLSAFAVATGFTAYSCTIDEPLGESCGGKSGDYVILLSTGLVCSNENADTGDCKSYKDALKAHTCPAAYYCHSNEFEPNQDAISMNVSYYCSQKPSCHGDTHYNNTNGACEKDTVQACGSNRNDCNNINPDWLVSTCSNRKCLPTECRSGMHLDQGACVVDTGTSCGQTAKDCSAEGKICSNGDCVDSTDCAFELCGEACVNTLVTRAHCGECGNVCLANQECLEGECKCTDDKTLCGIQCVDVTRDDRNCGSCDYKCNANTYCSAGECVLTPSTTVGCYDDDDCMGSDKICVDNECVTKPNIVQCTTDSECGAKQVCDNKKCLDVECKTNSHCGDKQVCENKHCIDIGCTTDSECGAKQICDNKKCLDVECKTNSHCGAKQICETNACKDVECTTNSHCASGQQCQGNTCVSSAVCERYQTSCNGVCVDLSSDINNCGSCGNKCDAKGACVLKQCQSCDGIYFNDRCYSQKLLDAYNRNAAFKCFKGYNENEFGGCIADSISCEPGSYIPVDYKDKVVKAYCIGSIDELVALAKAAKDGKKWPDGNAENAYILSKDVQFTGTNLKSNWIPIGTKEFPFKGIFFGNSVPIKLNIRCDSLDYCGVFGYTDGAVIKDVYLDMKLSGGYIYAGSLVAHANNSVISRCLVEQAEISIVDKKLTSVGDNGVGGLVGSLRQSVAVSNTVNVNLHVDIDHSMAGGIAGFAERSQIEYGVVSGEIVGNKWVGGIVGELFTNASINFSFGSANVIGTNRVGGLAGGIDSSFNTIENSAVVSREIRAKQHGGGLVGFEDADHLTIRNNFVVSDIILDSDAGVGLVVNYTNGVYNDPDQFYNNYFVGKFVGVAPRYPLFSELDKGIYNNYSIKLDYPSPHESGADGWINISASDLWVNGKKFIDVLNSNYKGSMLPWSTLSCVPNHPNLEGFGVLNVPVPYWIIQSMPHSVLCK